MDLRQLKYFLAVVEQGSFSRASAKLNIAQPALSLHVRNMEAALGTQLLFRSARGALPTEAGQILVRNARIILDQFEVAQEEIRGHKGEPVGEVRLGLPGTISQILSVPLIIATRARLPKVKLRIAEAMSGFVLEWIRESRVDLAVLYIPITDRALTSYPMLAETLCLLGPTIPLKGVELTKGAGLSLAQIAELPLILPGRNHGLRNLLETTADENGLTLNTVIDVDSYGSIKELVERGVGYSILPVNAVMREAQSDRVATWPIIEPEINRRVHLVHPADRPMTKAVAAIEELTREVLLDLVRTGQWGGASALR